MHILNNAPGGGPRSRGSILVYLKMCITLTIALKIHKQLFILRIYSETLWSVYLYWKLAWLLDRYKIFALLLSFSQSFVENSPTFLYFAMRLRHTSMTNQTLYLKYERQKLLYLLEINLRKIMTSCCWKLFTLQFANENV